MHVWLAHPVAYDSALRGLASIVSQQQANSTNRRQFTIVALILGPEDYRNHISPLHKAANAPGKFWCDVVKAELFRRCRWGGLVEVHKCCPRDQLVTCLNIKCKMLLWMWLI